jgi:hypothetical protein
MYIVLIANSNPSSFSLTPIFNASLPKLDFNVQLSLRTVFSVTVEAINVGALFLDLPAFNLTVNTMTNALSNCQAPPSGTPTDKIYRELIHTTGTFLAELSYELLGGAKKGTLDTWPMWTPLDKCFLFPGLGNYWSGSIFTESEGIDCGSNYYVHDRRYKCNGRCSCSFCC